MDTYTFTRESTYTHPRVHTHAVHNTRTPQMLSHTDAFTGQARAHTFTHGSTHTHTHLHTRTRTRTRAESRGGPVLLGTVPSADTISASPWRAGPCVSSLRRPASVPTANPQEDLTDEDAAERQRCGAARPGGVGERPAEGSQGCVRSVAGAAPQRALLPVKLTAARAGSLQGKTLWGFGHLGVRGWGCGSCPASVPRRGSR